MDNWYSFKKKKLLIVFDQLCNYWSFLSCRHSPFGYLQFVLLFSVPALSHSIHHYRFLPLPPWHLILASKSQSNGEVCLTLTQIFSAGRGERECVLLSDQLPRPLSPWLLPLTLSVWMLPLMRIRDGPLTSWCAEYRRWLSHSHQSNLGDLYNKWKLYKTHWWYLSGTLPLYNSKLSFTSDLIHSAWWVPGKELNFHSDVFRCFIHRLGPSNVTAQKEVHLDNPVLEVYWLKMLNVSVIYPECFLFLMQWPKYFSDFVSHLDTTLFWSFMSKLDWLSL